jgi:hypothetical protein
MQLVLDFHSTFLDMSRSTTEGHLRQSVTKLRRAETTAAAPQRHILKQPRLNSFQKITVSSSSQLIGAHDNVTEVCSPDARSGLIRTFAQPVPRSDWYGRRIHPHA